MFASTTRPTPFNTGSQYSTYANRDNAPGIASGADLVTGRFTHSIRGSYEKFHNLLGDTTAGNHSVYNPLPGIGIAYNSGPFSSGPNPNAPQQTFQSDKQLRYDGSWTRGAHNIRYGASLNRIQGGGLAAFFGFGPQATIDSSTLLANCGNVAGAAPCPGDPADGYSSLAIYISNNQGYASENPGFGLPGGSLSDWRTGFYVVDAWKIKPTFTLTLGARYDRDTGRTNSDLAPIPCSAINASNFSSVPCTGNSQLLDQWGAGLGNRVNQPNKNIGPQVGFTYNPAASPKTVLRGGMGIYFESNVFNNVQFDRASRLQTGKFASYPLICGQYGTSYPIAGKGNVTATSTGVPIATICSESLAQASTALLQLQTDARAGGAQNIPNSSFVGNNLNILNGTIAYAPTYKSPYSIDFNFGVQREIIPGTVFSADYVHVGTLRIQQQIDANHVGDSRYLNVANAQAAVAATTAAAGCVGGTSASAINCAIAANGNTPGGAIAAFAANGLDSGRTLNGGAPNTINNATQAAFTGVNPNVGVGLFAFPEGKSGYDGLQLNLREQKAHPFRGIIDTNLEVSYAYSRFITTGGIGSTGSTSDQFFTPPSYNNRDIAGTIGYGGLDHRHIFSVGGAATLKYGPRVGLIAHLQSAPPTNLSLDTQGARSGEIFRSDVDGDGQVGDLVPGTRPGDYMRHVKPNTLNNLINNYNATRAGTFTPAGQALIAAGIFTPSQLYAAGGVEPTLAPAPGDGFGNSMLRTLDANFSYPIHVKRLPESLSLEPSVSIYNVANFANYAGPSSGAIQTAADVSPGNVNGPSGFAVSNTQRVSRKTGTFDQGAPRSTEFQLKLNF